MEKGKITSYKDLVVWQKSMLLAEKVYELTNLLPKEESYGLKSQMRRCVVSIASNIAEGKSRGTRKDYRQFLIISYGSCSELETQLELCKRLGFVNNEESFETDNLLIEVSKMLNTLIRRLKL